MPELPANVHQDPALRNLTRVFRNRRDGGESLARLLQSYRSTGAVVLGIPAGGVPVAASAARLLSLPLDFYTVSKITLPWNTEAGYGAVAADGSYQLNELLLQAVGLDDAAVRAGIAATRQKVERRSREYRALIAAQSLEDAAAIVVDDGLASGFTMRVAVDALRRQGPVSLTVAVPTGHLDAVVELAGVADAVYCANIRRGPRFAVADAYEHWSDVSDDEVRRILSEAQNAAE